MNFTALRYAILFLSSEIYIVHVINHEWNRSIFVASAVYFVWDTKSNFPTIGIRAKFSYHVCITCDWVLEFKKTVIFVFSNFCINFLIHGPMCRVLLWKTPFVFWEYECNWIASVVDNWCEPWFYFFDTVPENFCGSNIKQKSYFHLKIVVPHNHGFYIEQNCVPLLATQACCLPRYSCLSLYFFWVFRRL